ncbi:MHYT domain-containing protein, NO-binding membrane sensor [Meinhardsimonia xiamenensis]|jgi:NO-binding membrane sensor protein with MHYT domain|uniref:MHYT domain-containing protein, NO-binding membrane sensor n=2 Tax=Meinhardsimonia xiamenensis TaxID=990712 RepID=A0A1G8Y289_9RHOB|nr:MHYT domain-containing protein [Meinhardsimonia xiamenensis]PRX37134.1 NO-binding membrane sensor protein with MHYT domain [Meinhardsimonia xiamenensis]SDJ96797.1 MHYT domain-containing protein, NO-binding membrane sensor [Meinhardsimonia xiamenensis]
MLEVSHNGWLVIAAFAVALMAGFTGLSLTKGASALPPARRKLVIVLAAVILGGGIWSMHFVAMLGLQLPILFYYDALVTLISALVAILVVGVALLLLHFRRRTPQLVIAAGVIVGLGIVVMHFIGMEAMRVCRAVYDAWDVALSAAASVALSVAAIGVAYGARTHRNILLGTVCFAAAVVTMHFTAISLTDFVATGEASVSGPALSNEALALGVTLAVFLICGGFVLTGISLMEPGAEPDPTADEPPLPQPKPSAATALPGVPYEREGQTFFAPRERIAAIRAEGHYTILYMDGEQLFCPWSITEAEARLKPSGFLRAHRSYLINPSHVTRFERARDNGLCHFERTPGLGRVPVSRSRLAVVREALGV